MASSLLARLKKLETEVGMKLDVRHPKVVRFVCREGEEEKVRQQAIEMGLDPRPESNDLLIIRLISSPNPRHRIQPDPKTAQIEQEHVSALLAAVDGKTRSL